MLGCQSSIKCPLLDPCAAENPVSCVNVEKFLVELRESSFTVDSMCGERGVHIN